jgi:hypothetical protein
VRWWPLSAFESFFALFATKERCAFCCSSVTQVSNYALPGHRCRHNQVYWQGTPYYAFGVGAASYLLGERFSRPAKMQEY